MTLTAPIPQLSLVPTVYYTSEYDIGSIFDQSSDIANIDDQVRVDLAMHYQHDERWPTISVVGQNLTDRRHLEFVEELTRFGDRLMNDLVDRLPAEQNGAQLLSQSRAIALAARHGPSERRQLLLSLLPSGRGELLL